MSNPNPVRPKRFRRSAESYLNWYLLITLLGFFAVVIFNPTFITVPVAITFNLIWLVPATGLPLWELYKLTKQSKHSTSGGN